MERRLCHLEGERRPETHERTEGERSPDRMDPQERILPEKREERAHQRAVTAREIGLRVGKNAEDGHTGEKHQPRSDKVHLAPPEPLPDSPADHP